MGPRSKNKHLTAVYKIPLGSLFPCIACTSYHITIRRLAIGTTNEGIFDSYIFFIFFWLNSIYFEGKHVALHLASDHAIIPGISALGAGKGLSRWASGAQGISRK